MNRKSLERLLQSTRGDPEKSLRVHPNIDLEDEEVKELERRGLIRVEGDVIKVNSHQRLRLVEEALKLNGDPEQLSRNLNWREFEDLAVTALREADYSPSRNFIFKDDHQRHQIDVVGVKFERILCVDCKHWRHRGFTSRIRNAAVLQSKRAEKLSRSLGLNAEKLSLPSKGIYTLIPCLIFLGNVSTTLIEGVPVVSIIRLRDFLDNLLYPIGPKLKYYRAEV